MEIGKLRVKTMKDKLMGIESRSKDIKDKYQAVGNPNSL